ncbi:phage tail assembly chaperone [Romboutsia sp. 1001285H_161024_C4]|uniref:phage tail assembly chaperone n=1 Tax=Romboutsia sp. 1001285H_161024_C4 TaxID=2787109 RepID=UPI00189B36F0|nr:hypothetical protein [Romboutsia sp. 1001285H_161024_C4]
MTNKNEVIQTVELNAVELLLSMDINEIEVPKSIYKMYCKKLKKEIAFEIEAVPPQKMLEIQQKTMKFDNKGGLEINNVFLSKARTITEGCKMFKDMNLVKHFGCATPHQLIEKILVTGEITELSNAITSLSEVEKISDDEIKN